MSTFTRDAAWSISVGYEVPSPEPIKSIEVEEKPRRVVDAIHIFKSLIRLSLVGTSTCPQV